MTRSSVSEPLPNTSSGMKDWTAALFRGRNGYLEGEEVSMNQVLKDQPMFTEYLLATRCHTRCFIGLNLSISTIPKASC